eukprot:g21740.t1
MRHVVLCWDGFQIQCFVGSLDLRRARIYGPFANKRHSAQPGHKYEPLLTFQSALEEMQAIHKAAEKAKAKTPEAQVAQ